MSCLVNAEVRAGRISSLANDLTLPQAKHSLFMLETSMLDTLTHVEAAIT
jgi:hypothetical protein